MGMIFGKIKVETPKHETIRSSPDYEIRKYPPCVIAQVTYIPSNSNSEKDVFTILANYIGAFSKAQNAKPEKIAMTAPVITQTTTSEQISMTAPVITTKEGSSSGEMVTMGFILPEKYKKADDAPRPVDERVVIRDQGERKYGVVRFGWAAREKVVAERVGKLKACLERDGFMVVGDHVLARYNPPWITYPPWITLPMFRTNEVMIPVE